MKITSFTANSFEGQLVRVEVDIRRGIPGVDIIGLPDGAVLESRDRLRAALRNSGFDVPKGRILINLAPAGIRKEGASFDLAIAAAVLVQAGVISAAPDKDVMILGELMLSGEIRPVAGVLSAVAAAVKSGIEYVIVPQQNLSEAESFGSSGVCGINSITELPLIITSLTHIMAGKRLGSKWHSETRFDEAPPGNAPLCDTPRSEGLRGVALRGEGPRGDVLRGEGQGRGPAPPPCRESFHTPAVDFADIKGLPFVKRALEVAAAGRHNALLFGPPGGGKTICSRALSGILPGLSRDEAIEVTRIQSAAGLLREGGGLIRRPPFREPHHSASEEGVIGGGRTVKPGGVSLAHKGVLFLDETPEFSKNILQSLREPVEEGRVDIARAGRSCIYPADFQLILAANPCPCGNLGNRDAVCVCSKKEVMNYWKKLGGALLDRIDIRIPVEPVTIDLYAAEEIESSRDISARVAKAVGLQEKRYRNELFS